MKKVLIKIDGMTCSACSSGLEKYLNKQDGIKIATVNLVMNNASIEYDDKKLTFEQIETFIYKAGFKSLGIYDFDKEEGKNNKEKYKLIFITILSFLILYISMSQVLKIPGLNNLNIEKYPIIYSVTLLVLTILVLILGRDILKNGYKNLIHISPNMDTLVMIGAASSFIYSIYSTIQIILGNSQYLQRLYYDSSSMVIFFVKIGKYIESRNKNKTKDALKKLVSITPKTAVVVRDSKELAVTIDEINKGDIVICKPGEKIAVDGKIVDGNTHIDESLITGESTPVKKGVGSDVIAGSINYDGIIKYRAVKIGKESTLSEIIRMVINATSTKAPIAKIADKISSYFVPVVLIIAILAFVIWLLVGKGFAFSFNIFVSVLLVACPCSLGLATPLAVVIASGKASKEGILIKSSEALENTHKVKTICFDKTGTLTNGHLRISKIYNYSNLAEEEIIRIIASIENKSNHPIAKAIVEYANSKKILIDDVKEVKSIAGYGLEAITIDGKNVIIGNRKLIEKNKIIIENKMDEQYLLSTQNTILFVSINNEIVALIGVKDTIKPNVYEVINKLKQKNIDIYMITGDNENVSKSVAKECGIDNVIAEATPQRKAREIAELKKRGTLIMCGDGINDSISLVTSDIGISISSGTDIAIDSAQIIIMDNNLEKINELIEISRKTIKNIKQNLFWAFFYNICMIPIACGVLIPIFNISLNPIIAALSMTISSLSVVLNALRLKV